MEGVVGIDVRYDDFHDEVIRRTRSGCQGNTRYVVIVDHTRTHTNTHTRTHTQLHTKIEVLTVILQSSPLCHCTTAEIK